MILCSTLYSNYILHCYGRYGKLQTEGMADLAFEMKITEKDAAIYIKFVST